MRDVRSIPCRRSPSQALRDFAKAPGWEVHCEYVARAPANDLLHRSEWRRLLEDAARRRFSPVPVFKPDRAFRSVNHMHDTLAACEPLGSGFRSVQEWFDTHSALGRLLMNLLASLALFDLRGSANGCRRAWSQRAGRGSASGAAEPWPCHRPPAGGRPYGMSCWSGG